MKIIDAINTVELLRGVQEDHAFLVQELQALEGRIELEIHGKQEWIKTETLGVPAPYDRLYWLYLLYTVDMTRGDKERFERSSAAFKEALDAYAHHYRTRLAKGR